MMIIRLSVINLFEEDLLCVRLQTLGIVENSFPVRAAGISYDWKLYDVGGAVRVSLHDRFFSIYPWKFG